MAANLIPPQITVRSTTTTSGNSESHRKNWWTPLFGWSSEPDYIDYTNNNSTFLAKSGSISESDLDRKTIKSPTNFTDEKARKLRMLTVETASFHDAMYHSAIASRLASDFSDRTSL